MKAGFNLFYKCYNPNVKIATELKVRKFNSQSNGLTLVGEVDDKKKTGDIDLQPKHSIMCAFNGVVCITLTRQCTQNEQTSAEERRER